MTTTERKNTEEFIGKAEVIMNDNGDFGLYVASTYFTAEHLKVFVEGKKIKLTTENLEAATFCVDCKGLCDYLDKEKRCHHCRPKEDPALYCADCYSRVSVGAGFVLNNNITTTPTKALCTCGKEITEWDNVKMCNECLDKMNLNKRETREFKCHCCNKPAEEGQGRIFVRGYWICNACEDACDPKNERCSITNHKRIAKIIGWMVVEKKEEPPTLCHNCQKPLIDDSRRAADEKVWCGECYKKKIEEKDPRGPYCPFGVTSQKIKDPKHPLHSLYKALCSKAQITGDLLSSCTAWETRDKCWTMFDDAKNDLLPICPQCLEKLTKGKEESWQCKNEACSINVIFKKI